MAFADQDAIAAGRFFIQKYKIVNNTINITGNVIIDVSADCPAARSASVPVNPADAAFSLALSIHIPITGCQVAVANIPTAPTIDMPSAPLAGIFSAVKPSIFGQK